VRLTHDGFAFALGPDKPEQLTLLRQAELPATLHTAGELADYVNESRIILSDGEPSMCLASVHLKREGGKVAVGYGLHYNDIEYDAELMDPATRIVITPGGRLAAKQLPQTQYFSDNPLWVYTPYEGIWDEIGIPLDTPKPVRAPEKPLELHTLDF